MPERDFELYLSLLSRFLRLKPAQHAEIADELRDHLEQRLEELTARGLSHDEAIRRALDELGDAAELAQHFTRATHIRRRRLIMRCTLGTIGTLAASLLVALAFWPVTPQSGIAPNAIAENPPAPTVASEEQAETRQRNRPHHEKWGFLGMGSERQRILTALGKPTEVQFIDTPLAEAIAYLRDFHQINIWIDKSAFDEERVSVDQPITFQGSGISFRSVLRLLLEPLAMTYVVSDEVLKITSPKKMELDIGAYNIRDMVGARFAANGAVSRAGRPIPGSATRSDADAEVSPGAEAPGVPARIKGTSPKRTSPIHQTSSLAELVVLTIEPDSWIDAGGNGSAIQYDGVLVIRNSPSVHAQVHAFLKLLRETLDEN